MPGTHTIKELQQNGFQLGNWYVYPNRNLVRGPGGSHRLEPKIMAVLVNLAAAGGNTVSRQHIHEQVWQGSHVTSKTLTRAVWELRRIFGDDAQNPQMIETIARLGYRLMLPVRPLQTRAMKVPGPLTATGTSAGTPMEALSLGKAGKTQLRPIWPKFLLLGLLLMSLSFVAWRKWPFNQKTPTPPALPKPLSSLLGHELRPKLSPNADRVVFSWPGEDKSNWNLYLKQVKNGKVHPLTQMEGSEVSPSWSPDSSEIAYFHYGSESCGIYIIPALAGTPRKAADCFHPGIANLEFGAPQLTWSPDGKSLAFPMAANGRLPLVIGLLSLENGTLEPITSPPADVFGDWDPNFSPDGKWLSFTRLHQWQRGEINVLNLKTKEAWQVTTDHRVILGHTWSGDSTRLYFSSNRSGAFQLWTVPRQGGEPQWFPALGTYLKQPSISKNGTALVYENWNYDTNLQQLPLGSAASQIQTKPLVNSTGWDDDPHYNAEKDLLAFVSNRHGSFEIYLYHFSTGELHQLTHLKEIQPSHPRFSPDGGQLVFQGSQNGTVQIYRIPVAGGPLKPITSATDRVAAPEFSSDGQSVLFSKREKNQWQIWRIPVEGGKAQQITKNGGFGCKPGPDHQVIYHAILNKKGIWKAPVNGGPSELVVADCGLGDWGNWGLSKQGIYYPQRAASGTVKLAFWDFLTNTTETLIDLEGMIPFHQAAITVLPEKERVIFSQISQTESDTMFMPLR